MNTTPNVPDIASRFALFYMNYFEKSSDEKKILSEENAALLLEVVTAAGFDATRVEVGTIHGSYDPNDLKFTINKHCPFRAINSDRTYPPCLDVSPGHSWAWSTGWLDYLFFIASDSIQKGGSEVNIALYVKTEIERARPLELIRITADGDSLEEIPPDRSQPVEKWLPGIFNRITDDTAIPNKGKIGIHKNFGCGGEIHARYPLATNIVATCNRCSLRITFPRHIATYEELRSYFNNLLSPKEPLL